MASEPADDHVQPIPMTAVMRSMWLTEQLAPESVVNHIAYATRHRGSLDTSLLAAAITRVVSRHETLRSSVRLCDDTPVLCVHESMEVPLHVVSVAGYDDEVLGHTVSGWSLSPFDLEDGPLCRFAVFEVSSTEQIFAFALHHLVSDMWSVALMVTEIGEAYTRLRSGNDIPEHRVRSTFLDHVDRSAGYVASDRGAADLEFWQTELAGFGDVMELPTDRPRQKTVDHRGELVSMDFGVARSEAVRDLAERLHATPYAVMVAVYSAVLGRMTRRDDIAISTVKASRSTRNARTHGCFINPSVLRIALDDAASFAETVEGVDGAAARVAPHESFPLQLVMESDRNRAARTPYSRVAFAWQKTTKRFAGAAIAAAAAGRVGVAGDPGGLTLESASFGSRVAVADFAMLIADVDGEYTMALDYISELFDRATIEQFGQCVLTLLDAAIDQPNAAVRDLPILDDVESRRYAEEWARVPQPEHDGRTLLDLFDSAVALSPDKTAVRFGNETTCYAELDRRTADLAARLRRRGVERGHLVGVHVARGIEMIVALIGVMKAGAAFVPLVPGHPAERLRFMVDDAGLSVVVADAPDGADFAEGSVTVVPVDGSFETERTESDSGDGTADGHDEPRPDDLAYAMFTSGSTGRPKAAGIEHHTLVNLFGSMITRPGIRSDDVVLAQTTLSFDMSMVELLLPLCVGAQVVVVDREVMGDGHALQRVLDDDGITIMQATPSVYRFAIDEGWTGGDRLTTWSCGEVMTPELARRLSEQSAKVWNSYGPTETSYVTWADVGSEWSGNESPVPLGLPIAGTSLYILDESRAPVPPGVIGELWIGGVAVGRGYIDRPDLTSERFVDDPFRSEAGSRMYGTGDLVRRRRDATLEFHGRNDDQVKVRGNRVEVGEVEAVLERHPAIGAAVAAVQGPSDSNILVAYVVPNAGVIAPSAREVQAFVARSLPGPMIPSVVAVLSALPLTLNGKVDRRALPQIDVSTADIGSGGPTSSAEFEAPRPGTEQAIAEIWDVVLGHQRIGRHDDFFALGGQSLLATKIASRLRRRFDRSIEIRDVFEHSTIAAQAVLVEASSELVLHIEQLDRIAEGPSDYPLTYSQERMWFLHQLDPASVAYNVSGAVRFEGPLDIDALRQAIALVVERHDALRTEFGQRNGEPFQRVCAEAAIDVPLIDCSEWPHADRWERIVELMETEARRPFDLTVAPLCRFAVYRAGPGDHGLMVSQHHIVSDQWSLGVLASEMAEAYAAFRDGTAPELDDVPLQLGQYAAWHRSLVETKHLDHDLEYWRAQLESITPLDLPSDRPRPPIKTAAGATIHTAVADDVMASIDAFCRDVRTTPFAVTSAAFQLLLARYSGESDIAIGTAIANRNWYEAEQVLGSLVNTLVLRTTVNEQNSFRDLVASVQGTALDAFAHQDMPFARLVTEMRASRDPSRSPLFQAFFNVQNAPFAAPGLPGFTTTRVDLERSAAQFDLSLSISTIDNTAALEYNTDLFDAERMEAMFEHYWTLLRASLADPDAPLSALAILTDPERQVVAEWSAGEVVEVDLSVPAHRLIETTAAAQPDVVAARFQDEQVTYRELNERANRLARHLVARGAQPGQLVGVLVDRSIDMLVSVLAVMKSGAAYVPMDPAYPGPRLEHMVRDSGVIFLVLGDGLAVPAGTFDPVVVGSVDLDGLSGENLEVEVSQDDLAYVIYTSGSTGRPKGVMIEHGNLAHYVHGTRRTPGMSASDVIVAVTTLSFDISVQELILPLVVGAEIVIVPRSTAIDGAALQAVLSDCGATVMQATPTTWRMMIEHGWSGTPGLRVQCGGEAMTPELARDLCARADSVWNEYGPTEATVWATFHEVDAVADGHALGGAVQLGRAAINTTVHVLDEHLRDVPTGVRGELCIGGSGVGRGYLERPELTKAVFVELPGRPDVGRIYRTGDVVMRHRDGSLTFEGRTDHQVKLRGHRIELGEIEAALDAHPDVVKSVVTVHEVAAGDERLTAYLQCSREAQVPTAAALRAFVKGELPDYMVPTIVVAIEEFPTTANNKVDRGQLPAPQISHQHSGESVEPPRPGLETVVAHVWSDVLGVGDVGRHDDFFELGGHSLLAIRLFSQLEREVGNELALSALFEAPTVAGLAELLQSGKHQTPWTSLVPIRAGGEAIPLFYVSPFLVSVLALSEMASHLPADLPFYGLQAQGMESDDPIHDSVEEMAAHYIHEMRTVQPSGPYRIGGHCAGAWVAFEMVRQLQTAGETVDDVVFVDYGPPGQAPPPRRRFRDLVDRIKFYRQGARLLPALKWKLSLIRERFIIRRIGGEQDRRRAEVRARHAAAHARYVPQPIDGDIVLIRSAESASLADRGWHMQWENLTSGALAVVTVDGTHAELAINANAPSLAAAVVAAMDPGQVDEAR